MPNWVVHIAAVEIFPKRWLEAGLSYLILGAVLPDMARFSVVLFNFLDIQTTPFGFFEAFHTPFIMAIMAFAIALLTKRKARVFSMVFMGAMLHLFCDILEPRIGGGIILFYPFNYREFIVPVFGAPNTFVNPLVNIASMFILFKLYRSSKYEKVAFIGKRNMRVSASLVMLCVLLAYATMPVFLEKNVHSSMFIHNPKAFEGKHVVLHVNKVISENPPTVFVRKGRVFKLKLKESLRVGDWVSLEGTYHRGVITVSKIFVDITPLEKALYSIIGLVFLLVIWKNTSKQALG